MRKRKCGRQGWRLRTSEGPGKTGHAVQEVQLALEALAGLFSLKSPGDRQHVALSWATILESCSPSLTTPTLDRLILVNPRIDSSHKPFLETTWLAGVLENENPSYHIPFGPRELLPAMQVLSR